jgi:ABC-2 type transport system permease protein
MDQAQGQSLGLGHGQLGAFAGHGADVLDFSAGQPYRLPIAVWNEDHSALSRQLVRMLQATPGLEVRQSVLNRAEAADALLRMDVYGVVHIPPDLEPKSSKAAAAW